jgi:pyrroline-5-carboxylate reductase
VRIAVVGVGNLGAAIAGRLLKAGFERQSLSLITRGSNRSLQACRELHLEPARIDDISYATLVLLAVKPQDAREMGDAVRQFLSRDSTILSVMAGVTCEHLSSLLGHQSIVRAMPTLGAIVGESATTYFVSSSVSDAHLAHAEYLIAALGKSWRVSHERLIDLTTAVAGSGPAYLCWLGEQMELVARQQGLSDADAHALVLQTFKGAVAYIEHSSDSFASLRERVTSPNGTTAAALSVLSAKDAADIMKAAVEAAFTRAQQLALVPRIS